ncbi:hypothetical protein V0I11_02910 [Pasteurella multocida]|uniref:hypothetical protein n=1 Tax=Pasteurella multocida TaxID=747 RepID=UPI00287A9DEE|nr:hypothetical protein [Pasteurella multocida]WVM63976.1 hypothetical protein V0I11_02910 [Pasteurella multocida]HDX1086926.1 hypothetical protein [Pasteurella multocida]
MNSDLYDEDDIEYVEDDIEYVEDDSEDNTSLSVQPVQQPQVVQQPQKNFSSTLDEINNTGLPFTAQRNPNGSGSITVQTPEMTYHAEYMDQENPSILTTCIPTDPKLRENAMRHLDNLRFTQEKIETMTGIPQSTISNKLSRD